MTPVRMVNSVGEHIAGEEYDLDTETADRFILLGYAEGAVSRPYSDDELAALAATRQVVSA
jgi:hypothetical protein